MKNTMLKRLLSFVMVLAMLMSYVVMPAAAETAEDGTEHTHNYVAGESVAATCTVDGYTTYTCGCGNSYAGDAVTATGHSYENGICTVCGSADPSYVAPINEEPAGCNHTWGEGVTTGATCTESGSAVYTCTVEGCGETKTDTIDALGHSFTDGICTVCGDADPDYVAPCEHIWGEGVTTDATCTASGSTVYTCTVEGCGEARTDTIDSLGHSYENGVCAICGTAEPVCNCTVRCAETVNMECPVCSTEGGICAYEEEEPAPEMPKALYFSDQDKIWGSEVKVVYVDAEGNTTEAALSYSERGYFYSGEVPAGTVSFYFTDGVRQTQPQTIDAVLMDGYDMCVIFDGAEEWMEYAIWEQMVPPADNTIDLSTGAGSITTAGEYTVTGTNATNSLTIDPGAESTVTVTLSGVSVKAASGSAISIESGNAILIVDGSNTLTGATNGSGIYVAEGASVTIQGTGSLTAVGNTGSDTTGGAAGIGNATGKSGSITIQGGVTVNATGYGKHASGIGGAPSGTITIDGATVTAQGGHYSEGGKLPEGDKYGSALPEGGAAIGGGYGGGSNDAITIKNNATVTAKGGSKAAGIGAGYWASCSKITIENSSVTAYGGVSSAGIGTSRAGSNGVSADIEIGGTSVVNATGGYHGAGIGGGYNGHSLTNLPTTTITIKDSAEVTATGANGGAGIGGGYKTNNLNISISDTAEVTANASLLEDGSDKTIAQKSSCAIGTGANGTGTFEGSTVDVDDTAIVTANGIEGGKPAIEGYVKKEYVAQVGENKYETLSDAVAAANAIEGGATVTLLADVELGEKLTISGNVTISGEHTITRADTYTGTLFAVNAGAALTLDDGLTIDGNNNYTFDSTAYNADLANWENPVSAADSTKWFTPEEGAPVATAYMITTSGTVNLNDVSIKNHYSTNGSGIVSASKGANVTLDGAQITHNASTSGSGLVVNASGGEWSREKELITVTMNAGTVIDGNHVGGNHGIFKIYMGTYFTMNGGEIKNTTGWNSNGTVVGIYHAVFTMNGGTICSNSSVYGPNNGRNAAIYGHSNHLFTMNGGTICHNTGRSKAGIDSPYSETGYTGLTVINGGTVEHNKILGNWTTPDVSGGATLTITGGTYTQDVNQWCADGRKAVQGSDGKWEIEEAAESAQLQADLGEKDHTSVYENQDLAAEYAEDTAANPDVKEWTIKLLMDSTLTKTLSIAEGYTVTIDAGNYKLLGEIEVAEGATLSIISGTFNDENAKNYVAAGYMAVDNNDGTWTVKVSPAAAVAQVGDEYFLSIQDAINFAAKGENVTVKVVKDHTVDVNTRTYGYPVLVNGKNITLDMNGKTVTFDYNEKSDSETVWASIRIANGGSLTVTGNGTLYNKGTTNASDAGARIVWVASQCSLSIENGTYINEQLDTMFYTSGDNSAEKLATLYIKDGNFKQIGAVVGQNDHDCFNMQDNTASNQLIELSGGTYNEDPRVGRQNSWEVTIAEGYAVKDNGDNTWSVVPAVAKNVETGVGYATLQEALNEAVDEQEVKLLTDLTYGADDIVYAHGGGTGFGKYDKHNPSIIYFGGTQADGGNSPSTVNAVLDLNGHSITNNADAYLFLPMDNSKLTIKDSGNGDGIIGTTEAPVIWAVGTYTQVTIESGKYTTANDEGLLWSTHGADLVINGGTFKTTADDASLLIIRNEKDRNNADHFVDGNATITVNGGTYYGFNPEKTTDDSTNPYTIFNAVAAGKCVAESSDVYTVGANDIGDEIPASNATCTKPAMRAHYECAHCGKTFLSAGHTDEADVAVGTALGHKYDNDGGWQYDEATAAQGHYELCENGCGTKGELVAHTRWSDWAPVKTRAIGQESRYCLDCNYTEYRNVHVHELVFKYNSTYHWQECKATDNLVCDHEVVKVKHNMSGWKDGKYENTSASNWRHQHCLTEGCDYRINRPIVWSYSDNPKTGDYIAIAFGVMAISATALVTLLVIKKKKR